MRRTRWIPVALAASLAIAACSGSGSNDDGGNAGAEPDPTGPWPLTGLPGYPNEDQRRVITVKVDNTGQGSQEGIADADLVVEEMVEGGLTRLAVMFQSATPSVVGPVRSMRETDIGIVAPTGGTLAASGASSETLAALDAAGLSYVQEGAAGFSRDPARRSPYNVMLDVSALSSTLQPGRPPQPYFEFGSVPQEVSGTEASGISMSWPSGTTSFTYDPSTGTWNRGDADLPGYDFTNIVALQLNVTYAGADAAGTPIPTMETEGSGSGKVATQGQVYDVQWQKASAGAPWSFSVGTGEGQATNLPLTPGRTWLALVPVDGGSIGVTEPAPAGNPEG